MPYTDWHAQRRNNAVDPLSNSLSEFAFEAGGGGSATLSQITSSDLPDVSTTAIRATLTNDAPTWRRIYSRTFPVAAPGEVWTFSVWIRSSRSLNLSGRIQWRTT